MHRLNIKPLSLNAAYRGRRFATPELRTYKMVVMALLPKYVPIQGKQRLSLRFGVSSRQADGDNLIKCFQDALADKYGFNDKMIYKWEVEKVDVKKTKEFIEFELKPYES